jgi:hypothetical protein
VTDLQGGAVLTIPLGDWMSTAEMREDALALARGVSDPALRRRLQGRIEALAEALAYTQRELERARHSDLAVDSDGDLRAMRPRGA